MPKVALPISGGSYQDESSPVSQQRLINMYVDVVQAPALSQEVLKGMAGINQLATTGTIKQVNRGMETFKDRSYQVNGTELSRLNRTIDGDGVETFATEVLGTIEGSGFVFMVSNGTQLMILVPGVKGYIFTDDPQLLVEITDTTVSEYTVVSDANCFAMVVVDTQGNVSEPTGVCLAAPPNGVQSFTVHLVRQ